MLQYKKCDNREKKHLAYIGAGDLILLRIALFRDPVLDFLPIDQSGWQEIGGTTYGKPKS